MIEVVRAPASTLSLPGETMNLTVSVTTWTGEYVDVHGQLKLRSV